jgi:monoamine oxidase
MRRPSHSQLTAMLREAHASCHEAAITGAPIDEVTALQAERRRARVGAVSETLEVYNDSVRRARERGAPEDERARRRAMVGLTAAANGEVSRRRFLARSGAFAASAALAGATAFRPTPARAAGQPRIVIVGGGAAGLRCAHRLWTHSGWTSTVYEANATVGGRIETNRGYFANGQLVEMHGEFISSEHAATLALASSFGLTLDDTIATPNGTGDTCWFNGARYTQAQLNADWQSFGYQTFHTAVKTVPWPQSYNKHNSTGVTWDNMSVPDWMTAHLAGGTTSTFGKLMLQDVIAEYGGDPADQSALNLTMLLGYDDSAAGKGYQSPTTPVLAGTDERWHLTGGNDQLTTNMVSQLPAGTVKTGQVLQAVKNNGNGTFTCTFNGGGSSYQVTADRLVFACPFKTLRNVDLSQAGLSALKMTAINNLGMGNNGKILMQFNGHPWVNDGFTGNTLDDTGPASGWEANYQTSNYMSPTAIFVDFPGGSNTLALLSQYGITQHEGVPPASLVSARLATLEPVFPGITAAYNGKAWYHFGTNDPYVQGAYSYWRLGQYTRFSGYEGVAEGNAHFCGEHTAQNFQGFIEGAITSGERVAGEV